MALERVSCLAAVLGWKRQEWPPHNSSRMMERGRGIKNFIGEEIRMRYFGGKSEKGRH